MAFFAGDSAAITGFAVCLAAALTGATAALGAFDTAFSVTGLAGGFLAAIPGLTGLTTCFSVFLGLFAGFLVVSRAIAIPLNRKHLFGSFPFRDSLFHRSDQSAFRQRIFSILTR
ncbi:MAG: hypothetical protein NTZ22_13670 [Hyphomicrobiales bacterium]|nr:hypothetical protein [Hyphomicrobiales bacterium]